MDLHLVVALQGQLRQLQSNIIVFVNHLRKQTEITEVNTYDKV